MFSSFSAYHGERRGVIIAAAATTNGASRSTRTSASIPFPTPLSKFFARALEIFSPKRGIPSIREVTSSNPRPLLFRRVKIATKKAVDTIRFADANERAGIATVSTRFEYSALHASFSAGVHACEFVENSFIFSESCFTVDRSFCGSVISETSFCVARVEIVTLFSTAPVRPLSGRRPRRTGSPCMEGRVPRVVVVTRPSQPPIEAHKPKARRSFAEEGTSGGAKGRDDGDGGDARMPRNTSPRLPRII